MFTTKKKKIDDISKEITSRLFRNISNVLELDDYTLNDYHVLLRNCDNDSKRQLLEKVLNERLMDLKNNFLFEFYKECKPKAESIVYLYSKNDGEEKYLNHIVSKGCSISDDIIVKLLGNKTIDLPISIMYIIENYLEKNSDYNEINDIILCIIVYITSIERYFSWDK